MVVNGCNIKLCLVVSDMISLSSKQSSPCGVMAKVLDGSFEVSQFKHQLCYYIYNRLMPLEKV